MKKLIVLSAVALVTALPATASAQTPHTPKYYVSCGAWYVNTPHRCDFASVRQASSYQMVPMSNLRWRSWGGYTAHARGTFHANSGYHAKGSITLYRPVRDDEGDFIYTRIKGTIGRGCEAFYDGHRWCDPVGHKHHFHSKVTL